MRWEEFEKDIKDDGREAELIVEIEQIRELQGGYLNENYPPWLYNGAMEQKDFFISYNKADEKWATWTA
ncbi:MAG TPA: hypothetical protein VFT16_02305 [Candidatus Saccharimonadales bacterium]|nr:hypothetical protein [Candidatus Saccharimonadales bacterium]